MTEPNATTMGLLGSADGKILRALDIITMTRGPSGGCRLNRAALAELMQALNTAHDNIEAAASRLQQTQS